MKVTFHLFRIKARRNQQRKLLEKEMSFSNILQKSILEKPSGELRKGHTWHIGNVLELEKMALSFAIGRTTRAKMETYDDEHRDFIEEVFDAAPYTSAIVDLNLQVVAIARKTELAASACAIARQLSRLLNLAEASEKYNVTFNIEKINDPEGFISQLEKAYAIKKFWLSFSAPNPWDVEKDFHQPMQKLVQEADATKGKTEISGGSLDPQKLVDLSRSAATSGEEARATLLKDAKSPSTVITLSGNPASFTVASIDEKKDKIEILNVLRKSYNRMRKWIQ